MTQEELFPDLRHDSTYSYEDDTGTDEWYGKNARLMTTEFIKHYEYYDSDYVESDSEDDNYYDEYSSDTDSDL